MQFATKLIQHYPSHLGHVAALPWEIKNSNFLQIFCRYGRKCKQIVFVHRLLCACNCVCWVYLCVNRIFEILSIRRHRPSYFLFIAQSAVGWPPVKPMSRNFVNSLLRLTPRFVQLFSGNSSVNLFAVYPFKYKLFIKMLSSSLNMLIIWIFNFPWQYSNMPKVRWCMGFVANFIRFPAVQKLWKSVTIWQSYRQFKNGNFLRYSVVCTCFGFVM